MLKQFPTFFFFWTFFYHVPVMLAFNCQQPVKITQESGTKLKKKWCFWRWGWVSGFDVDACGRDRISSFLATMATDESAGSWVFSRLKTVSHKARFKFACWIKDNQYPQDPRFCRLADENGCAFQLFISFLTSVSLLEQYDCWKLWPHPQTGEVDHLHIYSLWVN